MTQTLHALAPRYAPLIRDNEVREQRWSPHYVGPEYLSDEYLTLAEMGDLALLMALVLPAAYTDAIGDADPDEEAALPHEPLDDE